MLFFAMCYYLFFDSEAPLKGTGILLSAWDSPVENYRWQPEGDFPGQFLRGRCECPS